MKTRTLLLLSVGTALAILVAGGVFLLQLTNQDEPAAVASVGETVSVGDATVTVLDVDEAEGVLAVGLEIGGVDDVDGVDTFRLVTGDQRLAPLSAGAEGRCVAITVAPRVCRLDFDVSAVETSSRVLVMRRGDQQTNWRLT
jgi:hypothetical protein